jgi:hypothetical protein
VLSSQVNLRDETATTSSVVAALQRNIDAKGGNVAGIALDAKIETETRAEELESTTRIEGSRTDTQSPSDAATPGTTVTGSWQMEGDFEADEVRSGSGGSGGGEDVVLLYREGISPPPSVRSADGAELMAVDAQPREPELAGSIAQSSEQPSQHS